MNAWAWGPSSTRRWSLATYDPKRPRREPPADEVVAQIDAILDQAGSVVTPGHKAAIEGAIESTVDAGESSDPVVDLRSAPVSRPDVESRPAPTAGRPVTDPDVDRFPPIPGPDRRTRRMAGAVGVVVAAGIVIYLWRRPRD